MSYMRTNLNRMALELRISDLVGEVITLQEKQQVIINSLLQSVDDYREFCEKSAQQLITANRNTGLQQAIDEIESAAIPDPEVLEKMKSNKEK